MRRLWPLTILICMLPALTGCNRSLYKYREVEQLLIIQTMGLDSENGGVLLSLASAADAAAGDKPRKLRAQGSSITAAMDRMYNYSFEEELFCYHVDHVLIGEKAAEEGINEYLSYICRSPTMRIEVPLYVLRDSTAEAAIMDVGESTKGVVEVMQTIRQKQEKRGGGSASTTADVSRELMRCGSTLISALSCTEAAELSGSGQESDEESATGESGKAGESGGQEQNAGGKTLVTAGYAIIRDGKLCRYIQQEDAIAVDFLKNNVRVSDIELRDKKGQPVVLELYSGAADIRPVWSAPGELSGLDISVSAKASVLEIRGQGALDQGEYTDYLVAQLEAYLSQKLSSVLQSSRELRSDFLCLADTLRQADPENYRLMTTPFPDALPSLSLTVTVSGELSHANDMKED